MADVSSVDGSDSGLTKIQELTTFGFDTDDVYQDAGGDTAVKYPYWF